MSFQGADVDGLDRTANRCMEGADFADTVAKALEILVAALEAMSWTGFAAALAAYLKAVVIPWVKYIAKCLRIFGGLLQLASRKQKDASEDSPQVVIPATAWNPPPAPTAVNVAPPMLTCPDPAIHRTDAGTGAQTGGGSAVAPTPTIGGTATGGTGGGGGSATAPTPSIGRTDPGSTSVTGGGTVTTVTGIGPDGKLWTTTSIGGSSPRVASPTAIPTASSALPPSGGLGGGSATATPDIAIDDCFGTSGLGSGSSGSGLGTGSGGGSAAGPGGGSGSGGPSSGSLGSGGGTGSSGSTDSPIGSGDPAVHSSPLQSRPAAALPTGGVGTSTVTAAAPVADGGAAPAMLAAPLGLAGVGTAALAALRARAVRDSDEEGDDAI